METVAATVRQQSDTSSQFVHNLGAVYEQIMNERREFSRFYGIDNKGGSGKIEGR